MIATKNNLSEGIRSKVVGLMDARLADCAALGSRLKQAHHDVNSCRPVMKLDPLLDKINEEVEVYADVIAERAVQMGSCDAGRDRMAAKGNVSADCPGAGREQVDAVPSLLAAFGKSAQKAITEANDLGDPDTAELFTEVSRGVERWLWFVESRLHLSRQ